MLNILFLLAGTSLERNPRRKAAQRAELNLLEQRVEQATALRRESYFTKFSDWYFARFGRKLLEGDPGVVDGSLAIYGQSLYESGGSLGEYKESISAVIEQQSRWRKSMQACWDFATSWKMAQIPLVADVITLHSSSRANFR